MLKLFFPFCLVAAFALASSLVVPGPRGGPPPDQSGTSMKCRDDKQDCPLLHYCKGGACQKLIFCHNDSGCNANQCCLKSGAFGMCSDAPKAGEICLVPTSNMGIPYCPCRSGSCKASPYSKDVGTCE